MAYSVVAESCRKVLRGKIYWKNIALPAILYGTSVITIPDCDIKRLHQIENGVRRKILGAPKYATIAIIKGEIGKSEMRSRIVVARLRYVKGIEEGNNELLKNIAHWEKQGKMKATDGRKKQRDV